MIQIKAVRMPKIKMILITAGILMAVIALFYSLTNMKFSLFNVNLGKEIIPEDICKTIMEKTIPVLDVSTEDAAAPDPQTAIHSLIEFVTDVDIGNPKAYLMSQIPLMSFYNISTFNVIAGGISGKSTSTLQVEPQSYNVDQSKPGVVIYHTHTRESYTSSAKYSYNMGNENYRTSNNNLNVCAVGEEIKKYLEKNYGIAVINDTTVHDFPSYNGSYSRSKPTAQNLIKKYPGASFVLDVHRDANVARKDMVMNVGGVSAAKVMFVMGKGNPHWQENYALAQKLSAKMEKLYPGFVRKITFADGITYNQDLSNKSLLIEIGADCNTLDEVLVSADMVARSIGEYIKGN